jgi:hypothetical protein
LYLETVNRRPQTLHLRMVISVVQLRAHAYQECRNNRGGSWACPGGAQLLADYRRFGTPDAEVSFRFPLREVREAPMAFHTGFKVCAAFRACREQVNSTRSLRRAAIFRERP